MNTRLTQLALAALLLTLPMFATACGEREATDTGNAAGDVIASDAEATPDNDTSGVSPEGDATEPVEDDAAEPVEDDATEPVEDTTECTPACDGKACGDDGCGGSCGDCAEGEACTVEGTCAAFCIPDCTDLTCGEDGCGGSCGDCADGETCTEGACIADCVPACNAANCGDDGCGGSCGDCAEGEACTEGMCMAESKGACDNAADLAVIETADVAQLSQDAAFACLQGFSVDLDCATDKIAEDSGMTLDCALCFGEQAVCVASNCAFQCFDPNSQSCNDCRNSNCTPLFEPCAGIEPIQ
ncbi:MAG: hypothetical protein ACPGU1_16900 [Myxococcota bacterium]